jgi:hypothetical protein
VMMQIDTYAWSVRLVRCSAAAQGNGGGGRGSEELGGCRRTRTWRGKGRSLHVRAAEAEHAAGGSPLLPRISVFFIIF